MRITIMILGVLGSFGAASLASAEPKRLFLDVHEVGPGKVTAKDVAGAHQKDLATEKKFGVHFKAYWVNAKAGTIYCLAEAPSAETLNAVHKEAHGMLATKIAEVTADSPGWTPAHGRKLYHQKDLAVGVRHGVKYLNYWLDEQSGTVRCLVEAPSAEAAIAVHREAHGLVPDSIEEVSEGR